MAYALRSDVENIFGVTNVAMWADLEGTADAGVIATRIEWALAHAETKVNDGLTGSVYVVPFTGEVPLQITEATARLAGCLLYGSRGVSDFDEESGKPINLVSSHQRMVDALLKGLKSGRIRLNNVTETGSRFPESR